MNIAEETRVKQKLTLPAVIMNTILRMSRAFYCIFKFPEVCKNLYRNNWPWKKKRTREIDLSLLFSSNSSIMLLVHRSATNRGCLITNCIEPRVKSTEFHLNGNNQFNLKQLIPLSRCILPVAKHSRHTSRVYFSAVSKLRTLFRGNETTGLTALSAVAARIYVTHLTRLPGNDARFVCANNHPRKLKVIFNYGILTFVQTVQLQTNIQLARSVIRCIVKLSSKSSIWNIDKVSRKT